MNRTVTDFLCSTPSFLGGAGTVFNLGGNSFDYNLSGEPDSVAISNDWLMVGQDIADSLSIAKEEFADR